ncbi:MAG TPA: serine hydrolase domain-containing protein [Leptospiraceae bacterium]|nr:serine hydrolase domain-containing protein [Leptospiraceae bacterium]HMX34428.1 serine hydrolase domain-containing protein [Leptospiraceae bacterium]HMY31688.1 serine hydrolase domain-containing protein [Leptospiraceae bacterium]HMZ67483.1 serine hydrolase domain-containing protein [Leptospiraceae bacterium]HNA08940.1 serine hydrolase domain-containing protein [Leptospiraceae bacterium]
MKNRILNSSIHISINSVLLILNLFLFNCNSLPDKPESIPKDDYSFFREYLNRYIPKKMKEASIVGLSVSAVTDKEVLFAKGFGYADEGNGKEATADTIFRTASVSKIINLIITMKLVEEGKLNLDKDISQYLPELKLKSRFPNSKPITIRSILTHHSGLPSDRMKGFFSYDKTDSLEKLISETSGEYVSYPPEFIYSYSNLGHSILGRIIEKVSGKTYAKVINEKIFQPFGMKNSFYEVVPEKKNDFAKGYGGIILKSEVNEPYLRDLPAGFLHSSVNDFSKVIQMFLNDGKINGSTYLKESTLNEIYTIQNPNNAYDDDLKIGLSFFVNTFDLGKDIFNVSHGGDTFLYHAILGILPKEKIGVIVLSNTDVSAPVINDIAQKTLEISLETKTGYKKPMNLNLTKAANVDMSSYAGTYQNGAMLRVEVENNNPFAKIDGGIQYILPNKEWEWQDGKLKIFGLFTVNPPMQFKFKTVGKDKLLYLKVGGNVLLWGSKITPQESIDGSWLKRLGKYKILNEDKNNAGMIKDPELKMENGFLVLETNGIPAANANVKQKLALQVLNEKESIIAGLGRSKADTISVKEVNGKEILTYSGYEMEKME